VKRFLYLRDPLFVGACSLYAVNRWLIKPHVDISLFHNWFNDALLIPCALPIVLLAHRWLGLRRHDLPPTPGEIAGHLVGWAALFEVLGPAILDRATGDPADVVAYAIGAAAAWYWWRASR
jgi:hypothetical protein